MAAVKANGNQRGSVLLAVLAVLSISTMVLVDQLQRKQQLLQDEAERTYLAELQVVAQSLFTQAGIVLERDYPNTQMWPSQWHVPPGVAANVQLHTENCSGQDTSVCYRVELTLYGRGGTSLQRSKAYWGEPGCGSAWLWEP